MVLESLERNNSEICNLSLLEMQIIAQVNTLIWAVLEVW